MRSDNDPSGTTLHLANSCTRSMHRVCAQQDVRKCIVGSLIVSTATLPEFINRTRDVDDEVCAPPSTSSSPSQQALTRYSASGSQYESTCRHAQVRKVTYTTLAEVEAWAGLRCAVRCCAAARQ